jgi:hypothetical protein
MCVCVGGGGGTNDPRNSRIVPEMKPLSHIPENIPNVPQIVLFF